MAEKKISDLTLGVLIESGDLFAYVDINDLTQSPTGSTKKLTIDTLEAYLNGSLTFLTTETDPVFSASPAGGILVGDITNWNTAFGWGDHSVEGYLTSFTETDPVFSASPAANVVNNLSNTVFLSGDGTYQSAGADGNGIYTGSGTIPTTTLSAVTDTAYFTGQTNSTILSLTKNTAIGGTGGFVGINTNGGNGNLEINAPTVGGKNYNFYSNAGGGSVFVHREQGAGIQGGGFSIGSGSQNVASLFVSDDAALGTVVRIDSLASGNEIYLPRTEGFVRFNKGINVGNTAAPQAGTVATFRGNTFIAGDLRIDTTTTSGASAAGEVWTATDALGNGSWQPAGAGADGNGIFDASNNGGVMGVTAFSTSGATTISHNAGDFKLTGASTQRFIVENTSTSQRPIVQLTGSNSRFAQFAYFPTAWSGTNPNYQDSTVLWAGNSVGNAILKNVISGTGTYTAYQIVTDTIGLAQHNVRMEMNSLGEFGFGTSPTVGNRLHVAGNTQIDGALYVTSNVGFGIAPNTGVTTYIKGNISDTGTLWAECSTAANGHFYLDDSGKIRLTGNNLTRVTLGGTNDNSSRFTIKGDAATPRTFLAQNGPGTSYLELNETGEINVQGLAVTTRVGLGIANSGTSFLATGAATTAKSSMRITPTAAANAPTIPINGDLIYVDTTGGAFTSIGHWGYMGGAWKFLGAAGGADGNGIYDGSGTVPTTTVSTLTDTWNITGGNVGLGIAPSAKLHVAGNTLIAGDLTVNTTLDNVFNGSALNVANTQGFTLKVSAGSVATAVFEPTADGRSLFLTDGSSGVSNGIGFLVVKGSSIVNAIDSFGASTGVKAPLTLNTTSLGVSTLNGYTGTQTISVDGTAYIKDQLTLGGTFDATKKLKVNGDSETTGSLIVGTTATVDTAKIGTVSTQSMFANSSNFNLTNYALIQSPAGGTSINAASGQELILRINNVPKMKVKSSGVINMVLPISPSGLSAGDLWNNAGVVSIV